ncbi:MMPL family transporter [Caldalkalibacillus mannanilyticus]|uniref:MMPL family transporter n=1 Tax=Caldalkalibacillus mannanilyticus TaxID=1418 RepID=UPI000468CDA5|nr:MMPL family transporter [Caldalkalibacillus mannanilyticus]
MNRLLHQLAGFVSSQTGSRMIVITWILMIVIGTMISPGAKEFTITSQESSIHEDTLSAQAQALLDEHFPAEGGLVALLVFHGQQPITTEERAKIEAISEWLFSEEKPAHVERSMPFHLFPTEVQEQLFSEDRTTTLLNVVLEKGLESNEVQQTLEQIREYALSMELDGMQFEITGPAGIVADTLNIFSNADLVLLFSTIGLILVLLMVIYRSPLLAIIPLVIAGMVYQAVDRLIGLAAQNGWIIVDKQALSIMMILLFAVLTDYCLFVLSRYREELKRMGSKYDAMRVAMSQVAEPILYSGGTVLVAVMVLFFAVFQPYHYFAPAFSIAMVIILLGGLTLIPAVFTLAGRKAFWPFIPKLGDVEKQSNRIWTRIATLVTKKPALLSGLLIVMLSIASWNMLNVQYSFNLMKSFPEELSSRQGFSILEEHFPKGRLAPVTVLLTSEERMELTPTMVEGLENLVTAISNREGIQAVTPTITSDFSKADVPLPRDFLAQELQAIKLQITLEEHPYDQSALEVVERLRNESDRLLEESGLDPKQFSLHYAGQTAQQLDVRELNQRDLWIVFPLVSLLIFIMLTFQARSIRISFMMMMTMLLSYTAALGLSWFIFHTFLGLEAMSYRLPLYTFVFLVALGVDYNIMLVSRIMEEARRVSWVEAIHRGVSKTGGVITSAGIILAATFSVLITQPLQELFLFGFVMAIGIMMDVFLIRGMLLPAILMFYKKRVVFQKKSQHF